MKLDPIIARLRAGCPSFGGRVFGLAALNRMDETTSPKFPCAYVLPKETVGMDVRSSTKYRQGVEDRFSVLVAVRLDDSDAPGRAGHDYVEDLKAEIFRCILGAQVKQNVIVEFSGQSVNVPYLNRYRLVETLEFSCADELDDTDTAQGAMIEDLDIFDTMHTQVVLEEDAPKVNHQITNIYEGNEE